jgi:hypothetical protein
VVVVVADGYCTIFVHQSCIIAVLYDDAVMEMRWFMMHSGIWRSLRASDYTARHVNRKVSSQQSQGMLGARETSD